MRSWDTKMTTKRAGFTLVEVMAAVLVVSILVALLVPAVNLVKETALTMRQQAQFNAIEVGLEGYRNDFGDYPESYLFEGPGGVGADIYCGAQRLAEAMLGRDGFGVHPDTEYRQDGMADLDNDGLDEEVYPSPADVGMDEWKENVGARKGPYLDIEAGNPEQLDSLYSPAELGDAGLGAAGDTWVLCDQLGQVRKITDNKRTGMPILYYKADPTKYMHDIDEWNANPNASNCTYNWVDNAVVGGPENIPGFGGLDSLPVITEAKEKYAYHLLVGQVLSPEQKSFYDVTANPTYTSTVRPYNPERFILICAGLDGVFGTPDDIMNFEKE